MQSATASRRAAPASRRAGPATPKGRPKGSKNFATLLAEALDEKVQVTEDGKRRRVTKRELVLKELVNKSASADLRAIKQLTDIVQGVERRSEAASAPPPPQAFTTADEEVIAELKKRIERAIRAKSRPRMLNWPSSPPRILGTARWRRLAGKGSRSPRFQRRAPSVRPPGRASLGQPPATRLPGNDE